MKHYTLFTQVETPAQAGRSSIPGEPWARVVLPRGNFGFMPCDPLYNADARWQIHQNFDTENRAVLCELPPDQALRGVNSFRLQDTVKTGDVILMADGPMTVDRSMSAGDDNGGNLFIVIPGLEHATD